MKEYLYIIRPARLEMLTAGATADEQRLVGEHFAYLKGLVDAGTGQLVGRTMITDERCMGLMIFRAESDTAAQEILAADPAVQGGVFLGEVVPWTTILKG